MIEQNRQTYDDAIELPQDPLRLAHWDDALVFRQPGIPIAVRRVVQPEMVLHDHDFAELVLVAGGSGRHVLEAGQYELGPGGFFLIGRGQRHAYRDPKGLQVINILIRQSCMDELRQVLLRTEGGRGLLNHPEPPPRSLSPEAMETCRRLIERMESETVAMQSGVADMLAALLQELLICLCRFAEGPAAARDSRRSQIGRALDFMHEHLAEAMETGDLAAAAGMSSRSFLRRFRELTGLPPNQYLQRLRILQSCCLLRTTTLTVGEIAAHCGFNDASYFCRIFRRHQGQTPSQFRPHVRGCGTIVERSNSFDGGI